MKPVLPLFLPAVALPPSCPSVVRKAVAVLLRHAGPVSTADLARQVHSSPFYLNRLFHLVMGAPPARLHRQWRIAFAAELLLAGMSPCDVAAKLEFSDQAHLTRLFAKRFGLPPARFVKEQGDAA